MKQNHLIQGSVACGLLGLILTLAACNDKESRSSNNSRPSSDIPPEEWLITNNYGPRTFNSIRHLAVWAKTQEDGRWESKHCGTTPPAGPVSIPECAWWLIAPINNAEDIKWRRPADEMKQKEIPGLNVPPGVDHKDIARLKEFEQLCMIIFDGKPVTDKALAHLEDMPNVKLVVLYGTNVTEEGVEELRNTVEGVKVKY